MSYATLVLGESGTGKTCSLRNLDPDKALLIQPVRKPLPFRSKDWNGHVYVCNEARKIVNAMHQTKAEVIIIDDFQYILSFKYMHSTGKKMASGEVFEFYKELGNDGFIVAENATTLDENKRVYILAHTQTDDFGNTRIKTLGKLLDEKIVLEGLFTTVLRTKVANGKYLFTTQTNGSDTVKSPMGMFETNEIDNDLAKVDEAICDYYGIERDKQAQPTQPKPTAKQSEKLGLYENDTHALIHEDAGDRI